MEGLDRVWSFNVIKTLDLLLSSGLPGGPRFREGAGTREAKLRNQFEGGQQPDQQEIQVVISLQREEQALAKFQQESDRNRFQGDWAARVENNGKVRGLQTDYHYFGTGTSAAHRMKTR